MVSNAYLRSLLSTALVGIKETAVFVIPPSPIDCGSENLTGPGTLARIGSLSAGRLGVAGVEVLSGTGQPLRLPPASVRCGVAGGVGQALALRSH